MNHASISPDGKMLLAVGDDFQPRNQTRAFFYKRTERTVTRVDDHPSYPRYEWQKLAEPSLDHDESEEEPCFCTAFSPSGNICAVASQSGIITIFDTSRVQDDMDTGDAVVAVLNSSRPSLRPLLSGAVRSMCFSPAPWDLLAWAEDQGRVCITDLRNAFHSRQTIDVEVDLPNLERVEVFDHESISEQRQLEIERRFMERHQEALEAQDHLAAVSHTADYLEIAAGQRRLDRESAISQDSFRLLTAAERQMNDAIDSRRLQSSHSGSSDTPSTTSVSVSYMPSRHMDSQTWTSLPSPTPSSRPHNRSTGTASIHDFMRHRNWERSRVNDRSYQPRRRSSVVISSSDSTTNIDNSSPHFSSSLAPIGVGVSTLSTSPSQLPSRNPDVPVPHVLEASDPWQTISDAMGSAGMSSDTVVRLRGLQSRNHERRPQAAMVPQAILDRRMQATQGTRERSRIEYADSMDAITNRARETNARVSRQMRASRADIVQDETDREALLSGLEDPRRRARNEEGVNTMGIEWSIDGRDL